MQLHLILRRNGWRSPEDLQAAGARSAAEAERRADVRWIRSYALEEGAGLGTVCIYEAESPEAIRRHAAAADLPVTEIVKVADTVIVRPDPTPAQEPIVDVVTGVYDALARGDVPAMLETMAEDLEWCEAEGMPYGGVYHGADAVAGNVLGPIASDITDFAVTPEQFVASGDTVAVVARYTGTGKATSKPLDLSVVHVWEVRGGRIARFRQFADTAKFLEVVPLATATTGSRSRLTSVGTQEP
jgi:ketosteroid isomerase-like protein